MGLSYAYPEKGKACVDGPLPVKYDGRSFGEIRKAKDGYQFFATGSRTGEPVHATLSAVQASLVSMQPSAEEKKTAKNEEDASDIGDSLDVLKQAKAGMKKMTKDLKQSEAKLEGATVMLEACYNLLEKQNASEDVLNLLNENVMLGETEVDGVSLMEDIASFLDD